jgi:hypothetical protein
MKKREEKLGMTIKKQEKILFGSENVITIISFHPSSSQSCRRSSN